MTKPLAALPAPLGAGLLTPPCRRPQVSQRLTETFGQPLRRGRETCAKRHIKRRGAATVELAICLPVMVTLVLGAIECSNVIFLKQSLTAAAYEAAQVVTSSGATTDDAQNRAESVLETFRVHSANVSFVPEVTPSTPSGTRVMVTVTAPIAENCTLLRFFDGAGNSSASVTMVRL